MDEEIMNDNPEVEPEVEPVEEEPKAKVVPEEILAMMSKAERARVEEAQKE